MTRDVRYVISNDIGVHKKLLRSFTEWFKLTLILPVTSTFTYSKFYL